MATIDKLDIGVHIQYAQRTEMVEQTNVTLSLAQATSVAPQAQMVDFYARPSEMELLLGVATVLTPWAYFLPPKLFRLRRRSPFEVARVIPSLGTIEEQQELMGYIESVQCDTPEEEREKSAILACFGQMDKINEWLAHIIGRIGQFLQG